MVVDPFINRRQVIGADTFLVEAGDPVHLDNMGYTKLGILVSNFVTPDYYRFTTGNRFDFRNLLPGPCPALIRGGALCVIVGNDLQLRVAPDSSPEEVELMRIHPGSRRDRWRRGHHNWRNSRPRRRA